MKKIHVLYAITIILMHTSCKSPITNLTYDTADVKILFLHHSTGQHLWCGDIKQDKKTLKEAICMTPRLLKEYIDEKDINLSIEERAFPSGNPYSSNNYPFDYYNIWVKNAGNKSYIEGFTLEILTEEYDVLSKIDSDALELIYNQNKKASNEGFNKSCWIIEEGLNYASERNLDTLFILPPLAFGRWSGHEVTIKFVQHVQEKYGATTMVFPSRLCG